MTESVIHKVSDFISSNGLMTADGRYIATLSGGADSVALLLLLVRMGYKVEAAHCNFHLRGAEADRDEKFCRDLCADMGVVLHVVHFDTFAYAEEHKVSIEMAARELRYDYFERLRTELCADGICVAHHINDSVETVIMNLVRGTGIRGLKGIAARNGYILRPLLCLTREEIEEYLAAENHTFVTDSSNLVNDVTRNRIRLDVLPLLSKINPSVVNNIQQTAHRIDEAGKVFEAAMNDTLRSVRVKKDVYDIKKIQNAVSPEYTLYYILSEYNFSPSQIEDIYRNLNAETGTMYSSSTHDLLFDRGNMLLKKKTENFFNDILIENVPCERHLDDISVLKFREYALDEDFKIRKNKDTATLDADKLHFPLKIRSVRTGDRFIPFGMKGSKLLSDYMTDRKMSVFQKESQRVVTDAEDNILWVIGERPDARFCITDRTVRVLEIELTRQ